MTILLTLISAGRQPLVSPKMFQDFYEAWRTVERTVQELMPKLASVLCSGEQVHCFSANIRTNLGHGQLLVTDKRLLLFTEVVFDCLEIACFADIQAVNQVQSFLKPMRGLCVCTRTKPKFVANLKTDNSLWYFILMEMWSGMIMANTFKDNHYVDQAISHVLQMVAVAHCLPVKKVTAAAACLAHFTSTMTQGPVAVSMSTRKSLHLQLSLASGLEGMHSVDAMIYIPDEEPIGATCSMRKEPGRSGWVWCALSWGRLVACNTQSWSIEKLCVQAGNRRVNCLLTVGNKQMWVGSSDCTIYIVDTATFVCNKRLTGHSGEVTGLELMSDLVPRMVISCSMNGQIFRWDLEKLEPLAQFQIPDCHTLTSMQLHGHLLWCCVERQVLVLEIDGCELQRFCMHDGSCYVLMNSVLLLPEKGQLLAACRNRAEIVVWDTLCPDSPPKTICLSKAPGISCMLRHAGQLWVSVKAGGATFSHIFVLDIETLTVCCMLLAEPGTVKCLCHTDEGFVLSAIGRDRPKVIVWRVQ
uniref:DENN domain-containing protein 3-like isoform X1 n=1 Tax=Myxine glutinosa TaxID=7769 RepID=UPI00358F7399